MPDIGPGPQNPILHPVDNLSQLPTFMAAIRWVESGSPAGNYTVVNSIGCKGAYQFCPGTSMYAQAQAAGWTKQAQDSIAAAQMTAYFNGPAGGSWYKVAEAWNGGPGSIGNTALVGGYASDVIGKMQKLGVGSQAFPQNPSRSGGGFSIPNPLSGLAEIGKFFGDLVNPATWARIGEIVLGGLLVIFAILKLFNVTPKLSTVATVASVARG